MTEANRRAIYDAARARERGEQQPEMQGTAPMKKAKAPLTRSAVPIEDAELFRTRIDEFLNAARTKAGFSGAVLVARGGKPVYEGG